MTLEIYKTLFNICPLMLKPIIRILLTSGINYRQFSKITRVLFVSIALDDFRRGQEHSNISRASIITGISRSEVRKLKVELEQDNTIYSSDFADNKPLEDTLTNAGRILDCWWKDPDYIDSSGNPKVIKIDQEHKPSFKHLMKTHGGDLKITAMLNELKKSKSIEIINETSVKTLTRYYMPIPSDSTHIVRAAHVISDFASTVHKNMIAQEGDPTLFEGRAYNTSIPLNQVDNFKEFMEKEGQNFLERIDDWLSEHDITNVPEEEITTTLAAGLYTINKSNKSNKSKIMGAQNV